MDQSGAAPSERRCVHCCEVIHPKARTCPHCHSPQKPRKLHAVAVGLKWIAGITALISLVIGMDRVNDIYSSWRDRQNAITELVAAARLQAEARDYAGGWRLLQSALALDAGARAARDYQGPFAMAWLRDMRLGDGQTFSELVDPLLPVLYMGTANPDKELAADMLAHIGWANYLKRIDGRLEVKIEESYARALELDPDNPYAHIHWAFWVLHNNNDRDYGEPNIRKARRHIDAALASGRDRAYVTDLAIYSLDGSSYRGSEEEMLRLAYELAQVNEPLTSDHMRALHSLFEPISRGHDPRGLERLEALSEVLPPEKLLATFNWILNGMDVGKPLAAKDLSGNRYIVGRLQEAAGNEARALAIYKDLLDHPRMNTGFRDRVLLPTIERLEQGGG